MGKMEGGKAQHKLLAETGKAFKQGGAVTSDEAQDRALVKKMVKGPALTGKKSGGGVKKKCHGGRMR